MTNYITIFAGKTKDGEWVWLYKNHLGNLLIKIQDGELMELSPKSRWQMKVDGINKIARFKLESPQWTGEVVGFSL